jgi:hypothetical protein
VKVGMIVPRQAVLFYCTSLINGLPGRWCPSQISQSNPSQIH